MRDILKTTIILTLICLVVTAALAVTDFVTKDVIKARAENDATLVRSKILPADSYRIDDSATALIAADPDFKNIKTAYLALAADGKTAGHIITALSAGYSGAIEVVTGIDAAGKIVGVNISSIKETPGLGMKALDAPFLKQLSGFIPASALKVIKTAGTRPEEIEAISGATVTSRAVTAAVQSAVDFSKALIQQAGGGTK